MHRCRADACAFIATLSIALTGADMAREARWHRRPVLGAGRRQSRPGACTRRRSQAPASAAISLFAAASMRRSILGSRATFSLGGFGGHATGTLSAGDMLHDRRRHRSRADAVATTDERPVLTREWEIGVLYGPHGAPDFFTDADIETLFSGALRGAFQQRAHRRAPDRPAAAHGRAPMAARRGCIPPTSTTMPMRSARSISPATCRSSSDPTGRALAASSARP